MSTDIGERDTLQAVRRQCTRMVATGLSKYGLIFSLRWNAKTPVGNVLGNKKAKMNYVNYQKAIMQDLGVMLRGWPDDVKFANPSEIGTVGEIRRLRGHLKSGQCHWVKMTPSQIKEHAAKLESLREAGQAVGKPRKKRSDAGTSRKRKQPTENQENEEPEPGPSRKRRRAPAKGKQKSVAIIETTTDDDSDDDDSDDE